MSSSKLVIQGAAGAAGAAGGLNVEDVFSVDVFYPNTSGDFTVTNGVDLSTEGGLVWMKQRDVGTTPKLHDTERHGGSYSGYLRTDVDNGAASDAYWTSFNTNGFTSKDQNGDHMVGYSFRKAERFFDIQTWTGTGAGSSQTVSHNLGSDVGMIITKRLDASGHWFTWHRSLSNSGQSYIRTNAQDKQATDTTIWNNTAPTSTNFSVGGSNNENGAEYIAYLFAHNNDDGGFGPDADADIVKCGSYEGSGDTQGPHVDLGFEPQWLLLKNVDVDGRPWVMIDAMRGFAYADNDAIFEIDSLNAEEAGQYVNPLATGFHASSADNKTNESSQTIAYIAIRRGPMGSFDDPDDLFDLNYRDLTAPHFNSTSKVVDLAFKTYDLSGFADSYKTYVIARTMGRKEFRTNSQDGADTNNENVWDYHEGWSEDPGSADYLSYMWRRAPSFCDVVHYKATLGADTIKHNLGVVPEMIWVKNRVTQTIGARGSWNVYHSSVSSGYLILNDTSALITSDAASKFGNGSTLVAPTATDFTVADDYTVGRTGNEYTAFLFASLDGISKCGSYTGDANSSQDVNCGFSTSARLIIIKETSGTSNWYVFDTARGITSSVADSIYLDNTNSPDSFNLIDPLSSGFTVKGGLNTSGNTYIFYAVA